MSLALLWSLGIGVVLPAVTGFITKDNLAPAVKTLILALLAGITGAVSGFTIHPPHGVTEWEQAGTAVLVAWVTAGASYVAGWKPSGAAASIAKKTGRFGIGPRAKAAA